MDTPPQTSAAYRVLYSIGKWILKIVTYILIALVMIALSLYIGGVTDSLAVVEAFLMLCLFLAMKYAKQ